MLSKKAKMKQYLTYIIQNFYEILVGFAVYILAHFPINSLTLLLSLTAQLLWEVSTCTLPSSSCKWSTIAFQIIYSPPSLKSELQTHPEQNQKYTHPEDLSSRKERYKYLVGDLPRVTPLSNCQFHIVSLEYISFQQRCTSLANHTRNKA